MKNLPIAGYLKGETVYFIDETHAPAKAPEGSIAERGERNVPTILKDLIGPISELEAIAEQKYRELLRLADFRIDDDVTRLAVNLGQQSARRDIAVASEAILQLKSLMALSDHLYGN